MHTTAPSTWPPWMLVNPAAGVRVDLSARRSVAVVDDERHQACPRLDGVLRRRAGDHAEEPGDLAEPVRAVLPGSDPAEGAGWLDDDELAERPQDPFRFPQVGQTVGRR